MSNTLYDIAVKTIDGQDKQLGDYSGQVLLIVNVASYCGYTSQYQGLQSLYQQYQDQGLRILGFPCNDYGAQEPGSNEEIKNFCETRYGVSFELFDKVHATGPQKHPLYQYLTKEANPPGEVSWNFEKFLIDKQGKIVGRYKSAVGPNASELVQAIETQLQN